MQDASFARLGPAVKHNLRTSARAAPAVPPPPPPLPPPNNLFNAERREWSRLSSRSTTRLATNRQSLSHRTSTTNRQRRTRQNALYDYCQPLRDCAGTAYPSTSPSSYSLHEMEHPAVKAGVSIAFLLYAGNGAL